MSEHASIISAFLDKNFPSVARRNKEIKKLKEDLSLSQARCKQLEDALVSIVEYWNRDNNKKAMEDACWYAVHTAAGALEAKETKL